MTDEIESNDGRRIGFSFVDIVTDEIKELCGRNDYVEVGFILKRVFCPTYTVSGFNVANLSERVQWDATGGAEGYFSYEIRGDVVSPPEWKKKGYTCHLKIDSWLNRFNSEDRLAHPQSGYIGDGCVAKKCVSLNVFVKPDIARSILDHLYGFSILTTIFSYTWFYTTESKSLLGQILDFFTCWTKVYNVPRKLDH